MSTRTSLEQFIQNVCTESHLRIEDDLGDGFVRLHSEEAERRQALQDIRSSEDILIEMLRNARDAGAANIYVSLTRHTYARNICMIDDGCGIPEHLHQTIFEPRVTSKLDNMRMDTWGIHGRGMALYSIAQNSELAQVVSSAPTLGSAFLVETDVTKLKEKSDQSTYPSFHIEGSKVKVLGPKNLIRTACEFVLESHNTCKVFLGSSTEIAAALYRNGLRVLSPEERIFIKDIREVPLCNRLSCTNNPDYFVEVALELGLDLSSRSARRIINGEIAAPDDLFTTIEQSIAALIHTNREESKAPTQNISRNTKLHKGIHFHDVDKQAFSAAILSAYQHLAQNYYLNENIAPDITYGKNGIKVFIPFDPLD